MELYNVSCLPELNINKNTIYYLNKSNEDFDDVENFVYNSIKNAGFLMNKNEIFGFEVVVNKIYNSLELDEDHTILCITYINNDTKPVYLTKINRHKYMYKKFKSENELLISFPISNNQIVFKSDSSIISNSNVDMIVIYKFKNIPENSELYESNVRNNIEFKYEVISNKNKKKLNVSNVLSFDFFNKLIYKRSENPDETVGKLVSYSEQYCLFYLLETSRYDNSYTFDTQLIDQFTNNTILNRFAHRYRSDKLIDGIVCDYICESVTKIQKNIVNENEVINISDDIHASKIIQFILNKTIVPEIIKNYNIPSCYKISVDEVSVNTILCTRHSDIYKTNNDVSKIYIDLMLSNRSDYEGNSHEFNDGIKLYLKKGDLISYWNNSIIKERILEKGKIILLTFGIKLQKYNSLSESKVYINSEKNAIIY